MISAFTNIFRIPELRSRILFTFALLVVVRVGAFITCPGVNASVLQHWFDNQLNTQSGGSVAALFNIFSGGSLENCAVFSLGVMPYISASIMMQLLTAVVPTLGKLSREEGGRHRISQLTRYATIGLCLFQGYLLALSFENPGQSPILHGIDQTIAQMGMPLVNSPGIAFRLIVVATLTAGTLMLMWLGDQITDRGIGNGMSLIISVGILSRFPAGLIQAWKTFVPSDRVTSQVSPIVLVLLLVFLFAVIASVICLTQGQRRISVQYAKRVVGKKVYGGQTQYMPLKVNYAGVMPIIFAQALLIFPSTIAMMAFRNSPEVQRIASILAQGFWHYVFYSALIFFFSYFWVATQFQPQQIADDLKKYGGYVPGVRPGQDTAKFLDTVMTRLTFAGAVFLVVVAILPQMLSKQLNVPDVTAQFFGGTSLLIVVGVVLDTMRQVETHLIQKNYDGFLRRTRVRGKSERTPEGRGEASKQKTLVGVYVFLAVVLLLGVILAIAKR
ncbi:MAG: preprotein translocase subunit SecY [Verrucomicrobiota bacterium]